MAEAGGVYGVGEPAAVVGDVGGSDGEEGETFGELVAVEDDFFRTLRSTEGAALAAEDGVLFSFFGADVVPPVAFAVGGGLVGLLDVAEHLVIELVAEGSEVGGEGFGVLIFGFEVGGDVGMVFVAQPGVVVGEGDAVEDGFLMFFAGGRRGGVRAFGHGNFKCSEGQGLGIRHSGIGNRY